MYMGVTVGLCLYVSPSMNTRSMFKRRVNVMPLVVAVVGFSMHRGGCLRTVAFYFRTRGTFVFTTAGHVAQIVCCRYQMMLMHDMVQMML